MAVLASDRASKQMISQANFQIGILNILDDSQTASIIEQDGTRGLLRLLSPGRGFGRSERGATRTSGRMSTRRGNPNQTPEN